MVGFLLNLLVSGAAVYLTAMFLPGVHVNGFIPALIVAFVLGIVNAVIKPILLALTLPINILTLGLFTFVVNALIILLTDTLIGSFTVDNFWWALLFSLILSFVSSILYSITGRGEAVAS